VLQANCTHSCYHSPGRQLQHALRLGSAQLLQQWRKRPPTSRPAIQAIKQAEVTAAAADDASANNAHKNAGSDTAPLVRRAMAEAGFSQDAIERILKQYPPYLSWDVKHKLLPAMHQWQQCLGGSFPAEFERLPTLLLGTPEQEVVKSQYLASIGVTSAKKTPAGWHFASLKAMQSKVASLQAFGFTQAQISSLVEQHPDILASKFKKTEDLLVVIDKLFSCANDIQAIADVILSCRAKGLISISPSNLYHRFVYFCTCLMVDDKGKKRAWHRGVFVVPPAELDSRLDFIALQLAATLQQAKAVVRRLPQIATLQSTRVGLHVSQLHVLGFSSSQVKDMCLKQPALLTLDYTSQLQVDKWDFLTCVLQLSPAAIAACPHLLMSSLPNRLGPRWEYLQRMKSCGVIKFSAAHEVVGSLYSKTDSNFRATYGPPESSALGVYDLHFQKQWQRRWHYLLVDQRLSIQDIGRHAAVLQIDLDTLGPRWAVLMSVASSVASFRPVDHLTALSTMSDDEFASAYNDI